MILRILLVESETEDVLFLRDVLEEMEGGEYWSGWLHLDTLDAPNWSFAEALLATERIDIILLSLNLPDCQGAEAFRHVQATAQNIPVVLLIDEADVSLAETLVRAGAQDFLIRKQVDCEPLAHSIRNSVERHRLLAAAQANTLTDSLTGLLNRSSFELFADRDHNLAEGLHRRMAILLIEPHPVTDPNRMELAQQSDLVMVETADRLRSLAAPTDLLGRISSTHLAVSLLETDDEPLSAALARFHDPSYSLRSVIFDPGQPIGTLDSLLDYAAHTVARSRTASIAHAS